MSGTIVHKQYNLAHPWRHPVPLKTPWKWWTSTLFYLRRISQEVFFYVFKTMWFRRISNHNRNLLLPSLFTHNSTVLLSLHSILTFQKCWVIYLIFLRNDIEGGLLLLYIPKTSRYFFLRNDHSRNIVGQDQEFWMTDTVKWHVEEWCIRYNYTLFIWAIYRDQKKWTILAGKRCTWNQWREVLLCICKRNVLEMVISSQ
jgi:hypothetical protein